MSAALTADDAAVLFSQLGPLTSEIILVGGQAVSFWADHYLSRDEELGKARPYTSLDIDFCATPKQVKACAERLGLRYFTPKPFDDVTPATGKLTWRYKGEPVTVDFLGEPFGLKQADVEASALEVMLDGIPFRVMSPQRCFESRVHNLSLPGYRSEHALKQLRAAIICAREYVRDALDDGREPDARKLNERSFNFCRFNDNAKIAFSDLGIDPFGAVLIDDRFVEHFRTKRYPQMRRILGR